MKAFHYILFSNKRKIHTNEGYTFISEWCERSRTHIPLLNGIPDKKFFVGKRKYKKIKRGYCIECTTLSESMYNDSPIMEGETITYNPLSLN